MDLIYGINEIFELINAQTIKYYVTNVATVQFGILIFLGEFPTMYIVFLNFTREYFELEVKKIFC